jgi:hypothetical protein
VEGNLLAVLRFFDKLARDWRQGSVQDAPRMAAHLFRHQQFRWPPEGGRANVERCPGRRRAACARGHELIETAAY